MSETTAQVQEILQQQAREIEELRLEIESLKRMMFEHRPAFIPAFHAARERVRKGEGMAMAGKPLPGGGDHECR
jgi:hypothetical protein